MYTTFQLKASELNEDFFRAVKSLFKSRTISITIEEEMDETDYLLSSEANRKMLERSLKSAEKGNLTEVNIDKYLPKKK